MLEIFEMFEILEMFEMLEMFERGGHGSSSARRAPDPFKVREPCGGSLRA